MYIGVLDVSQKPVLIISLYGNIIPLDCLPNRHGPLSTQIWKNMEDHDDHKNGPQNMNGRDTDMEACEIDMPETALKEYRRPFSVANIKYERQDKNNNPHAELDQILSKHWCHDQLVLLF